MCVCVYVYASLCTVCIKAGSGVCVCVYVKGAGGCLFEMDAMAGTPLQVPGSIAKGLFYFNSLHKSLRHTCIYA